MNSRGAIIFYPVVLILAVWFAWSAAAPFWGSRATMGLVRAGLGLYAVYCL